jgi:hypothetical protein
VPWKREVKFLPEKSELLKKKKKKKGQYHPPYM